jgi:hypothetical protein
VRVTQTGQGEFALEAHVTVRGNGKDKLGGKVIFSLNSQELVAAPLIGDKASLEKVELERGIQKIGARFETSPNYPGFLSSESRVLEYEVK